MNAAWLHPILMMASALTGLAIGKALGAGHQDSAYMEPFLMAMLFLVFLSVDVGKFKGAFRNVRFLSTALAVNFVWTPVLAFILAMVLTPPDPMSQIVMAIPLCLLYELAIWGVWFKEKATLRARGS